MKAILINIAILILSIAVVFGTVFGLRYAGMMMTKYFAPKEQNIQREVFENTQSFVEGKRQALTKYYKEWVKAPDEEKEVIRSLVMNDFASFNVDYLTSEQKRWYYKIIGYGY